MRIHRTTLPLSLLLLGPAFLQAQTVHAISVSGVSGSGTKEVSISGDGDRIAFVAVDSTLHGCFDVLLYDFATGGRTNLTGCDPFNGGVSSSNPMLSGDGDVIVFENGSNLWSKSLSGGPTQIVSLSPLGVPADETCLEPELSYDGTQVAFHTASDEFAQRITSTYNVYLRDEIAGATRLISATVSGAATSSHSFYADLSMDGRYVAFESESPNLLAAGLDTNLRTDVFVRDRDPDGNGVFDEGNATTVRVSVGPNGLEANGHSGRASISEDGRFIAFHSGARNLTANAPLGFSDVYVHDRDPDGNGNFLDVPGVTEQVSLSSAGDDRFGSAWDPKLSADGRHVLFWSQDPLIPNVVGGPQVYVHDRRKAWTHLVSSDEHGEPGNAPFTPGGYNLGLSLDGSRATFLTAASNLAAGDTDSFPDVYSKDLCPSAAQELGSALPGFQGEVPYFWFCGDLATGSSGMLRLRDARPGAFALAAISNAANPTPLFGGTFLAAPWLRILTTTVGPGGWIEIPVPGGGGPRQLISQWAVQDPDAPQGWAFSNALDVEFLP